MITKKIDKDYFVLKHSLSVQNQFIYIIIVSFLILIIGSSYFLKTSISIKSQGILQSTIEKAEIQIPVNGKIVEINLKDNQSINQGDILLKIDAFIPGKMDNSIQNRIATVGLLLNDLNRIIRLNNKEIISFKTSQYQAAFAQFSQDVLSLENTRQQAEITFKRYEKLYNAKVITEAEFEKYTFDLKQANTAKQLMIQKYHTQWEAETNQYREELRQLQSQSMELNQQQKLYVIKAPINGSLQNVSGLQLGSYVFANQKIAEISPDSNVIAFCYIKPSDIGLIRKEQQVRLNIDAFNYNQWGFINGKVIDISNDILMADNQPVFKVKCSLDQNFLHLKNGYKGFMKKGMTFNARFMVAERTLFQLLYDKVDDWVNPNLASNE